MSAITHIASYFFDNSLLSSGEREWESSVVEIVEKIADFIEDFEFLFFTVTLLPILCPLNFWWLKICVSRETFYSF